MAGLDLLNTMMEVGGSIISSVYGNQPSSFTPTAYTPTAPYLQAGGEYYAPGGRGAFWSQQGAPQFAPVSAAEIEQARAMQAQQQAQQAMMMQNLGQYATGQQSMARLAGQEQMQQLAQQQIAAAASVPGYNPALQRTAMLQASGAGQSIAGKIAQAQAAEQLAAQQAYLQAGATAQQQALAAQQAEQNFWKAQTEADIAKQKAISDQRMGYLALGQTERMQELAARQKYQDQLMEAMRGQTDENMRNRIIAVQGSAKKAGVELPDYDLSKKEPTGYTEAKQQQGRYVSGVGYV